MTKFAYIQKKSQEIYKKTASKIERHRAFVEKRKYAFLVIWFLTNLVMYATYVNLTSTEGYFLSQAKDEKDAIEFQYNITKLNMSEHNRTLRGLLQRGVDVKKINIETDVVLIDQDTPLAWNR